MRVFFIIVLLISILPGCQAEQGSAHADMSNDLSEHATLAVQNLSERLGVEPGEIRLVREEDVVWRDGSLGCPKKDMSYTQALVEGTIIVLIVNDVKYEFHSGHNRAPFYCSNPTRPLKGNEVE